MVSKRALLRTLERERIAFQQERAHLLDVICHLAGKPWTPAPEREPTPEWPDPSLSPPSYPDPDQLPD